MRAALGVTTVGTENDVYNQTVRPNDASSTTRSRLTLLAAERCPLMDYTERLRRLAINGSGLTDGSFDGAGDEPLELDPKSLALVRLGALVAVGVAVASLGAHADDAVNAGATVDEIVAVLVAVVPIVGLPRVVEAAPRLAIALGHDLDDDREPPLR